MIAMTTESQDNPQDSSSRLPRIEHLVADMVASFNADPRTRHIDATFLPSRARTIDIIEILRRVMFPGFFDDQRLTSETIQYHVGDLINQLKGLLYEQIRQAFRHDANRNSEGSGDKCDHCDERAERTTLRFLARLVEVRRLLATDVQAAFDGDPAATSTDEAVFCYPGVDAIFIHRIAHELYRLKVPLLPRIMSEYAHNETGIDIHPGATIAESFFIDHGTGVVIGETCKIGNRVKIYQGVTLGALSTKGGQSWRGRQRHPTIGDDVTIYGGAIILGDIVIGEGCTIGGTVFLTRAVEPYHTVTMKAQELEIKPRKKPRNADADPTLDFQI